ncbi:hypothetical protein JRQ81_010019 [Phrynocephalus forsythii]|uniref:TNFR-Cys domain-containing protein n=1 Tax=Phrynocephalus forsythii TaxID=171643 RepID=A0A9Q0XB35_9SAUR|nr:hypothetical protein JRQ81_010019 [Phrynocephalus forsythii]
MGLLVVRNMKGSAASPHNCAHGNGVYYDETARKCCYRCPAGYKPKTDCPADISSGCTKTQCQPEFYLNRNYVTPHCEACVTCNLKRHLVEKLPCTASSNRVCQCQAGWYCQAPLANSCQRCALHSSCKPGFGVRTRGTAETDTVCQECPPGTFSNEDSNSQPCRNHTDCAKLNKLALTSGNATHDRRCTDRAAGGQAAPEVPTGTFLDSKLVRIFGNKEPVAKPDNLHISEILGDISKVPPAGFNHSLSVPMDESKRIPRRDNRGLALLAATLLVVCSVLLPTVLLLRRRRVCAWWIGPRKLKSEPKGKKLQSSTESVWQIQQPDLILSSGGVKICFP